MADRAGVEGGSSWSMSAGLFLAIAALFNVVDGLVIWGLTARWEAREHRRGPHA